MNAKRSVLHGWQQFKQDYDEEQEYLAAEQSGVRIDNCAPSGAVARLSEEPQSAPDVETDVTSRRHEAEVGKAEGCKVQHALKVERFQYQFGLSHPMYSLIRLKGRWLAKIFPPNSRVVIEVGEGFVTIRKAS